MEFFRHCPACGRRFHIKLVSKQVVSFERERKPTKVISAEIRSGYTGGPYYLVTEGAPVTIDREEFQYAYKCGHCSHEWSEKRVERHKEG